MPCLSLFVHKMLTQVLVDTEGIDAYDQVRRMYMLPHQNRRPTGTSRHGAPDPRMLSFVAKLSR